MTNTDHEQRQQRIDAINAELCRLEDVRHAMTVYGKFTVRTVSRHGNGYQVRIDPVTWSQATVTKHVENAGYSSLGYGTDGSGMFVNVEEK
jgi:hypothetical protein